MIKKMIDLESIEAPFPLPENKRRSQLAIHAANCAHNWIDCALLEEYPIELRMIWKNRGESWLSAAGEILNGTYISPESIRIEEMYIFDDLIGRIEELWDFLPE